MAAGWVHDDPEKVGKDERLFRKIRHTDKVPNTLLRRYEPTDAAMTFHRRDGMSIHISSLVEQLGISRADIYDWARYHAIEFPASAPRSVENVGVVADVDDEDAKLGEAHGLIRHTNPNTPRGVKGDVRDKILEAFQWVEEDPDHPAGDSPELHPAASEPDLARKQEAGSSVANKPQLWLAVAGILVLAIVGILLTR